MDGSLLIVVLTRCTDVQFSPLASTELSDGTTLFCFGAKEEAEALKEAEAVGAKALEAEALKEAEALEAEALKEAKADEAKALEAEALKEAEAEEEEEVQPDPLQGSNNGASLAAEANVGTEEEEEVRKLASCCSSGLIMRVCKHRRRRMDIWVLRNAPVAAAARTFLRQMLQEREDEAAGAEASSKDFSQELVGHLNDLVDAIDNHVLAEAAAAANTNGREREACISSSGVQSCR